MVKDSANVVLNISELNLAAKNLKVRSTVVSSFAK
jgi:hypothetical protein